MSAVAIDPMTDVRLANLSTAQTRRLERVELLRALTAGLVDPAILVLEPPACLVGMFTFDFLLAVPRIGEAYVQGLNGRAVRDGVNLAVPLGRLTGGKREWLATRLRERGRSRLACRPQG